MRYIIGAICVLTCEINCVITPVLERLVDLSALPILVITLLKSRHEVNLESLCSLGMGLAAALAQRRSPPSHEVEHRRSIWRRVHIS